MKIFNFDLSIEGFKKKFEAYTVYQYIVPDIVNKDGMDNRIISYTAGESNIAEQYKVLRTNLYALSPDKPINTIVVTSAQHKDGKTITSCNLAATLSCNKEKKVILIDADLRRPSVHSMFGLIRKPGLSDILSGSADIKNFTKKPAIKDLYIIPSGTINNNPSDIFVTTKIRTIIEDLRKDFDYVIFDTPPVLTVTAASILGAICDCVILIVKAGVTQKSSVEEAFNMLQGAQARPKACVLTNTHFLLDAYAYYTKYKYSSYGYNSSENNEKAIKRS